MNIKKILFLFFKKHYLLIIGIIIVGLYSFTPQLIFENRLDDDYEGIYFSATSDELYYAARVQEVKDGHYAVGNAYLYENKDDPYLLPPVGEMIMVGFGKLFGLTTPQIMVYGTKLFFPIMLFIAIYFFALLLQKDKKIAFLSSLAIFLASNLVYGMGDLFNILRGFTSAPVFSVYLQPINPQISSLFFFLFMISLYLALDKKKTYLWIISGLLLGIILNFYFFTWAFILSFSGLLFLFFVWTKDSQRLKILISVLSIGIILSIPYFLSLLEAMKTPQFLYSVNNQGMISTHALILGKISLLTIVIFLLAAKFFKLPKDLNYYFLLALVLNTFVVINQQIITGKELYQGHFHWYYNTPIFFIILFMALNLFVKKYLAKFKNLIVFILFILIIYNGWVICKSAFEHNFSFFVDQQKYGFVVKWLNDQGSKNKVVASEDLILNSIIPAYTSADVYLAEQASWFFAPRERMEHNYLTYLWLKQIKPDEIKEYFENHRQEVSRMSSFDIVGKHYSCIDCVSPEMIKYLTNRYRFFYDDFLNQFRKYKIDYIISSNDLTEYSFLKKIESIDDYSIYRMVD